MNNKKTWIGIIVSVLCIGIFAWNINFNKLTEAIEKANYLWLIPGVTLLVASFYFRAVRWKLFLKNIKDIPSGRLMSPLMIGFMGNSVLPFRLGEFIRAYMLKHQEDVYFSQGIATIIVERVFDSICMLLMLAAIILFFPINMNIAGIHFLNEHAVKAAGASLLLICFCLLSVLIIIRFKTEFCTRIMRSLFKNASFEHKLEDMVQKFAEGLKVLQSIKEFSYATILSFGVWLTIAASVYFVLLAFHMGNMPFYAPIFIMCIVAIGVSAPSTPGYVGPFHAACQYAVLALGGEPNLAGGFAIILHLSQMLPVIIMGFYYLWKQNLTLSDIQKIKNSESS